MSGKVVGHTWFNWFGNIDADEQQVALVHETGNFGFGLGGRANCTDNLNNGKAQKCRTCILSQTTLVDKNLHFPQNMDVFTHMILE